jgi:hypothetical protein
LYPNPAGNNLFIEITLPHVARLNIEMITLTGKLIKSQEWEFGDEVQAKWDMEGIPAGVYIFRTRVNGVLEKINRVVIIRE